MLLQYFLTTLKPLDSTCTPPLSSNDFLRSARDCLSEVAVEDLVRLQKMTVLNRQRPDEIMAQYAAGLQLGLPTDHHDDPIAARYFYWWWLYKESHSLFVRRFAVDAMALYHQLAHLLARHKSVPSFIETSQVNWLDEIELSSHDSYQQKLLSALNDPEPLAIMHAVNQCLIEIVDQHRNDDPFSLDAVYAYFIELILRERHASFTPEKGQAILDRIMQGICHERA